MLLILSEYLKYDLNRIRSVINEPRLKLDAFGLINREKHQSKN